MERTAHIVYRADMATMLLIIDEEYTSGYILDSVPIQDRTDYVMHAVARIKLRTYAETLGYTVRYL